MIHELLGHGRENARTGRELAQVLQCGIRQITEQIERERRDGHPICAAMGANPGYYLAADDNELQEYCNQLKGRAIELFKTRQALVKVLQGISRAQQGAGCGTAGHVQGAPQDLQTAGGDLQTAEG